MHGDVGPPATRQRSTCSLNGCDKPHYAKGLCNGHYQRAKRTGDPGSAWLQQRGRVCETEGCEREHSAHGMCSFHYYRWRKTFGKR